MHWYIFGWKIGDLVHILLPIELKLVNKFMGIGTLQSNQSVGRSVGRSIWSFSRYTFYTLTLQLSGYDFPLLLFVGGIFIAIAISRYLSHRSFRRALKWVQIDLSDNNTLAYRSKLNIQWK